MYIFVTSTVTEIAHKWNIMFLTSKSKLYFNTTMVMLFSDPPNVDGGRCNGGLRESHYSGGREIKQP